VDAASTYGYLNDLWRYSPADKQWTWFAGADKFSCSAVYCDEPATYGTRQTPALGNAPSGRIMPSGWSDPQGNLWLYGGQGIYGGTNAFSSQEVREYQPNTNGSPAVATPTLSPAPGTYTTSQTLTISDATPGAVIYYSVSGYGSMLQYSGPIPLTSSQTILAIGSASGYANSNVATASYSITIPPTATPTFSVAPGTYSSAQIVAMSDTTPGASIYYTVDGSRPTTNSTVYTSPITVSSSKTILAVAIANGYLESPIASAVYTIGANSTLGEWAWMGGSSLLHQSGVYGTLQTPSAGNIPGARSQPATWTDASGKLWLFGGSGYDAAGNQANLNDLWNNPSTRLWTWVGGSSTVNCSTFSGVFQCSGHPGVYGTLSVAAATNIPGGRWGAASWSDNAGNLWLFGGYGHDSNGSVGSLNDLWRYSPSTNQWTWMGGSSSQQYLASSIGTGIAGVYGALRTPADTNVPGARRSATTWVDNNGNLWLFGGLGQHVSGH